MLLSSLLVLLFFFPLISTPTRPLIASAALRLHLLPPSMCNQGRKSVLNHTKNAISSLSFACFSASIQVSTVRRPAMHRKKKNEKERGGANMKRENKRRRRKGVSKNGKKKDKKGNE